MHNFSAALLVKKTALELNWLGQRTNEGDIIGAKYLEEHRSIKTSALQAMGNTYAEQSGKSPFTEMGGKVTFNEANLAILFCLDEVFSNKYGDVTYLVEHKMVPDDLRNSSKIEDQNRLTTYFRKSLMQTALLASLASTLEEFQVGSFVKRDSFKKFKSTPIQESFLNFGGTIYEVDVDIDSVAKFYKDKAIAAFSFDSATAFDKKYDWGWDYLIGHLDYARVERDEPYSDYDQAKTLARELVVEPAGD